MLYARVIAASNRGGDTEVVWDEFPRLFYSVLSRGTLDK